MDSDIQVGSNSFYGGEKRLEWGPVYLEWRQAVARCHAYQTRHWLHAEACSWRLTSLSCNGWRGCSGEKKQLERVIWLLLLRTRKRSASKATRDAHAKEPLFGIALDAIN